MLISSIANSSMKGALVPLGRIVGTGSQVFPNFSNIPQTYQDLRVIISARSINSVSSDFLAFNLNGDFSNLYSETLISGNGSNALSTRFTSQTRMSQSSIPTPYFPSQIFSTIVVDILNYRSTSTFKTILMNGASDLNGSGFTHLNVGLYRSTSAITNVSINLGQTNGNWGAGSTFTLYGIRSIGQ